MDADIHELAAPYALDALESQERREFEEHLASCEVCRATVADFQETAGALAYAVAPARLPAGMRERLLERARAERGIVIPFRRRRFERGLALVAVPAAAAAIAFGVWAGVLNHQLDRERNVAAAARVLNDPRAATVSLPGAGQLVVGHDRRGVLVVRSLRDAPSAKTYEAWVIEGGKARPAGLFRTDNVFLLTRPVPRHAKVAITLEPEGGSEQPTQAPLAIATA
jgi:anti-sigma-K factor RskA